MIRPSLEATQSRLLLLGFVALAIATTFAVYTVVRNRVNLQDGCLVHTDSDAAMTIAEGVVVGHGAILHGTKIGRDSLIGMGAKLLGGSEVGEESLVAAGALVTEGCRIPPRSVVMGMPAKVVRPITADELARTHSICAHYLEMAQRYVRGAYPPPWVRLNTSEK